MVGTTNQLAAVTRIVDQFQIPVSAHVVESTYLMLLIPHQEQGQSRHRYRAHITAARKLVSESCKYPAIGKQLFLLQLKKVITDVSSIGQAMAYRFGNVKLVKQRGIQHNQTSIRRSTLSHGLADAIGYID